MESETYIFQPNTRLIKLNFTSLNLIIIVMGLYVASIVLIFIVHYSSSYVLNHKCYSTLSSSSPQTSSATSFLLSNYRYNRMISYHASKTTTISATASGSGRGKKVKVEIDSVDKKEKVKVVEIDDSEQLKKVNSDKLKKVVDQSDKLMKVEVDSDINEDIIDKSDNVSKDVSEHIIFMF